MNKMLDIISGFFSNLYDLGLLLFFVIPWVIIYLIVLFKQIFSNDGLLSFSGRINRKAYFYNMIFIIIASFLFGMGFGFSVAKHLILFSVLSFLLMLSSTIYGYAITSRRYHDLNISGWMILIQIFVLSFVDIDSIAAIWRILANLLFFIPLFCIKGTDGTNKYGDDPLK